MTIVVSEAVARAEEAREEAERAAQVAREAEEHADSLRAGLPAGPLHPHESDISDRINAGVADKATQRAQDARSRAERAAQVAREATARADALGELDSLASDERVARLERAVADLGRWVRHSAGPGLHQTAPDLVALMLLYPAPNGAEMVDRTQLAREIFNGVTGGAV